MRVWKSLAGLAALLLAALSSAAHAQPSAAPPSPPGYTMPSTHVWDMAADDGKTYRIFVSFPGSGEPPERGYPVLYVLDGNAMFAAFAETRRIMEYGDMPQGIVVGVGYPGDGAYDVRRLEDLTPPLLDPPPPLWRDLAQYKSGGRAQFLDFLTGRLRQEIARRYKVDPDRQSLFGHSLGGLFGLYALYTRPQAFQSIVAASPSLEWNEQGVLAEERDFTARLKAGKVGRTSRLMLLAGGRDIDDEPELAEALFRRLDRLSGYGLRARLHLYEDEPHLMVPVRSVPDTLRFVFATPG